MAAPPKPKSQGPSLVLVPPKDLTGTQKLALLLRDVNKALGAEGRVYLGSEHKELVRIPMGVLAFDIVTGGGLVRGQAVELYGGESSGKTLLAMQQVATVQRAGGVAMWVKGEGLFDKPWGQKNGVDLGKLYLVEAVTGDTMLEAAMTLLESGLLDLLVIDSVQSLGTAREMKDGIESESYGGGGASQMWGRVMRRAYAAANGMGGNTAILWISQVRVKIGKFSPTGVPDPEPSGIYALRHWKAISVYCKGGEPTFENAKDDEKRRLVTREFKLLCKKNKTASTEQRAAYYKFTFRPHGDTPFGVDHVDQAYRFAKAFGLLEQKGAWIEGYGIRAQGEENFVTELRKSPTKVAAMLTDAREAAK